MPRRQHMQARMRGDVQECGSSERVLGAVKEGRQPPSQLPLLAMHPSKPPPPPDSPPSSQPHPPIQQAHPPHPPTLEQARLASINHHRRQRLVRLVAQQLVCRAEGRQAGWRRLPGVGFSAASPHCHASRACWGVLCLSLAGRLARMASPLHAHPAPPAACARRPGPPWGPWRRAACVRRAWPHPAQQAAGSR